MSNGKTMDVWPATRTFLERNPGCKFEKLLQYVMKKTGKERSSICEHFRSWSLRQKIYREKGRYWLEKPVKKSTKAELGKAHLDMAFEYGAISRKELADLNLAVSDVPEMFERSHSRIFPISVKSKGLNIRQWLVLWFHEDMRLFMHAARKIMGIRNSELPEKRKSELTDDWISTTCRIVSDGWRESLSWISKDGKKSWEEVFGSYEDDPLPLFRGLMKYTQTWNEALEQRTKDIEKNPPQNISGVNLGMQ